MQPGRNQSFDQSLFQFHGAETAVIADAYPLTAAPDHHGTEAAPDGLGIGGGQRLADDAADVIFTQNGAVELMSFTHASRTFSRNSRLLIR